MKNTLVVTIILSLIFYPVIALAQLTGTGSSPSGTITPRDPSNSSALIQAQQQVLANQKTACLNAGYYWENNTCSKTSTKTQQTLQRFRPGIDIQTTGKKVGGISFSGVGSSVLGCLNVGGEMVKGVGSLFNKKIKSGSSDTAKKLKDSTEDSTGSTKTEKSVPTNDGSANTKLEEVKKKETCLDAIAYNLSKQALSQVTNKTLNWINTGFGGDPFYVRDVNSLFRGIQEKEVGKYLNTLSGSSNQIIGRDVSNQIIGIISGKTLQEITTKPQTGVEKKYNEFKNDFSKGGWDSWINMTQDGQNPIAQFMDTSEKISKSYGREEELTAQELSQGGGYLSQKKCVEYAKINPDDDSSFYQEASGEPKCLKWETTTPGSLISSQAQAVTNTNTRQLEAADELNEVLGAFFDNMLNKLIQNGLNGLHKETARGLSVNYSASLISGGNVGGIDMGYQAAGAGANVQDFDISRPQQLRAVMQTQYNFLNTANDSRVALSRILPTVGALDYCIPGPNPSWKNGINENYQSFISSFETPSIDSPKFTRAIEQLPIVGGVVAFINSLFGFQNGEKPVKYALIGEPSLYDKAADGPQTISPWSFLYFTKDYERGVKKTDGDWIRGYVDGGYERIVEKYQNSFTTNAIIKLFAASDPNTAYATGMIKDSISETAKILDYRRSIDDIDSQYENIISDKEDQLAELEDIRTEVNDIVKKAKARYIASQAALGTPVNLSCINRAYIIDETPIDPNPRQESDTPSPMIKQQLDANEYFYTTL